MFGAQLQPGMDQDKALQTLDRYKLESLSSKTVQPGGTERARSKWLTAWQQTYDQGEGRRGSSEAIASGDWRLFFLQCDRVREAKLDDVQRRRRLPGRSNRTEGRYIPPKKPQRAPLEQRADLAAILKGLLGRPELQGRRGPSIQSPANIDKRTLRRSLDRWPNGQVELALLPKATQRRPRAEPNC